MTKRDSRELLVPDIIECGNKILRYILNMSNDDFASNDLVLNAQYLSIEALGMLDVMWIDAIMPL